MLKYLHIYIFGILLLVNLIVYFIVPAMGTAALIVTSVSIVVTGLLGHFITCIDIADGFKITLPWVFNLIGLFQYILSFFSSDTVNGNYTLLAIIVLFFIEIVIAISCVAISKHNQD